MTQAYSNTTTPTWRPAGNDPQRSVRTRPADVLVELPDLRTDAGTESVSEAYRQFPAVEVRSASGYESESPEPRPAMEQTVQHAPEVRTRPWIADLRGLLGSTVGRLRGELWTAVAAVVLVQLMALMIWQRENSAPLPLAFQGHRPTYPAGPIAPAVAEPSAAQRPLAERSNDKPPAASEPAPAAQPAIAPAPQPVAESAASVIEPEDPKDIPPWESWSAETKTAPAPSGAAANAPARLPVDGPQLATPARQVPTLAPPPMRTVGHLKGTIGKAKPESH